MCSVKNNADYKFLKYLIYVKNLGNMKKSEIVERLKEHVEKNPITLEKKDEERNITDPSEEQINKAYIKICEIWNSTEKSRNFLKHLIQSFLPVNMNNRIAEFTEEEITNDVNRCCILGIKMAGINDISDKLTVYLQEKLKIVSLAAQENREMTDKEVKHLKKIYYALPIEIQHATQGIRSSESKKYLSLEANLALLQFTQDAILNGEKDVEFTVNHKSRSNFKKRNTEKFQSPKQKGFEMASMLDEDTLKKLKGLK